MKFNEIGNKIWIVGPPGAGKSTLARYISGILNIPHYELDSFFGLKIGQRPIILISVIM